MLAQLSLIAKRCQLLLAPKGPNKPAQGNALGREVEDNLAL
jgi:hypothetical protein